MMEVFDTSIFLVIMLSGSILCIRKYPQIFVRTIPITCTSIVTILFLTGIMSGLKYGVIIILMLTLGIYIYVVIRFIMNHGEKGVSKVPYLWIISFLMIYFLMCYATNGKLFSGHDEFSHWGDIVKVMVELDDFGTNAYSESLFPSYPPGISLLQYFMTKIHYILFGHEFAEWLCYLTRNMLMLSFIIPFFEKETNKMIRTILATAMIVLAPMVFFSYESYQKIYADCMLGVLTGCGFAAIIIWQDHKTYRTIYISAVCIMLVLTKDAGLLMAAMIGLAYAIVVMLDTTNCTDRIREILWIFAAISIPKLLWNYKVWISGVTKVFSNPYDFKEILQIIFGNVQSYRTKVWIKFGEAFRTVCLGGGKLRFTCLVWAIILVGGIAIVLFYSVIRKKRVNLCLIKSRIVVFLSLVMTYVIFVLGICFSYMYKFGEGEALELASFSRYISIVYTALWIFLIIMVFNMEIRKKYKIINVVLLLIVELMISPLDYAYIFFKGYDAQNSIEFRRQYEYVQKQITEMTADSDSKLYFVAEKEDYRFHYLICKYIARPYSLIEDKIFSKDMDSREFMDILYQYDYLVLYEPNEEFQKKYENIFVGETPKTGVYYINKERNELISNN